MADRWLLPVGTCVTGQVQPSRARLSDKPSVFQNHENNRVSSVPESLFLTNGTEA